METLKKIPWWAWAAVAAVVALYWWRSRSRVPAVATVATATGAAAATAAAPPAGAISGVDAGALLGVNQALQSAGAGIGGVISSFINPGPVGGGNDFPWQSQTLAMS